MLLVVLAESPSYFLFCLWSCQAKVVPVKMLQSPLRPLVPLSALALLSWCWYTFRKTRNLCERAKEELLVPSAARKQSMVDNVAVQEAAVNGNTLAAQNVKTQCHFQPQEKQEGDQNLDRNCSPLSTTLDTSQATILTSTPIVRLRKGVRPEPEGEVSRAQVPLILAEKPETETEKEEDAFKGHSDLKVVETESFVQQPTGIVCPKEHGATTVSENQSEGGPSLNEANGLVIEVIDGATEEITAVGGGILKRKGHAELKVTPQSQVQLQKEIDENNSLAVTKKDLGALTKTVKESVSSAHKPSDPPSSFPAGKDSADGVEAEKASSKSQAVEKNSSSVSGSSEIPHALVRKNGKLSRQKADASKGWSSNVQLRKKTFPLFLLCKQIDAFVRMTS